MTNQKIKNFIIIITAIILLVGGIWRLFEMGIFEPTKTTQKLLNTNIDAPPEVVKFNYNYEKSDDAKGYSYLQIAHDHLWEITYHTEYTGASNHSNIRSELDNKLYIVIYNYKYSDYTPTLIDLSLFISKSYIEATARKINKRSNLK